MLGYGEKTCLNRSLLRVDDFSTADRVADVRKRRHVLRRVATKDNQIGLHPSRDAAVAARVSEPARRVRGERGEYVPEIHPGLRHQGVLERRIVMIGVTDIGTEQDLPARL